jgi:hypothetical protein
MMGAKQAFGKGFGRGSRVGREISAQGRTGWPAIHASGMKILVQPYFRQGTCKLACELMIVASDGPALLYLVHFSPPAPRCGRPDQSVFQNGNASPISGRLVAGRFF